MVHTLLTSRVGTLRVPPPQLVPPSPLVEEEDLGELPLLVKENGVIMENSSKEVLVAPTQSPVPHAFVARASSSALPVLVALLLEVMIRMTLVMMMMTMRKKTRKTVM